jgi:hypothetical protein
MTRDVIERLALYARAPIEVRRIALTIDQVRQYSPPPNFVKEDDKRTAAYVRQFGTTDCWELDALSPPVIAGLIRTEIEALIDQESWSEAQASEAANRNLLERAAESWRSKSFSTGGRHVSAAASAPATPRASAHSPPAPACCSPVQPPPPVPRTPSPWRWHGAPRPSRSARGVSP